MPFKLLSVLLLGCWLATAARAGDVTATEGALQAALLANFAAYTEWPALPAGVTPSEKIVFCVMGSPAVSEALAERKNKTINGKVMDVRTITQIDQSPPCQVLFVGKDDNTNIAQVNKLRRTTPLLLVAEEDDASQQDVVISLRQEDGRYTFKVNRTAAQARSLNLSAKLLRLAKLVY